jgi:hypothetical protein
MQFNPKITLFGQSGYWPTENGATASVGAGQYIGLMQVPNTMSTAYDWINNTMTAGNIYAMKYPAVLSYQQSQQAQPGCGILPPMTEAQLELEALSWYSNNQGNRKNLRPYLIPNAATATTAACTMWVPNQNNSNMLSYIQTVYSWCSLRGYPNCQ